MRASIALFITGLLLLFAPSFFYGNWNVMASLLALSVTLIVSAVVVSWRATR